MAVKQHVSENGNRQDEEIINIILSQINKFHHESNFMTTQDLLTFLENLVPELGNLFL